MFNHVIGQFAPGQVIYGCFGASSYSSKCDTFTVGTDNDTWSLELNPYPILTVNVTDGRGNPVSGANIQGYSTYLN